ncbi:MAG: TonB-dependent receptor plug domain-containing protein [Phycisphaerae bacterium]|nr:TonB-dependent receptor plug domain-containing protein [Gemmatimonadaceae bacterium]
MFGQRKIAAWAAAALVAGASVACGNHNTGAGLAPRASASGSRTITREMITKWNILDAYDAVERAGGYKLAAGGGGQVSVSQRRGQSSLRNSNADRPVLVVDGSMLTDFSALRQIRATQIERIDLLSSSDATQRYGTSSSGAGAIVVTTGGQR